MRFTSGGPGHSSSVINYGSVEKNLSTPADIGISVRLCKHHTRVYFENKSHGNWAMV